MLFYEESSTLCHSKSRIICGQSNRDAIEAKPVRHKLNTFKIFAIPLNVCSSTKCIRMVFTGPDTDWLNRRNENYCFSPFPWTCVQYFWLCMPTSRFPVPQEVFCLVLMELVLQSLTPTARLFLASWKCWVQTPPLLVRPTHSLPYLRLNVALGEQFLLPPSSHVFWTTSEWKWYFYKKRSHNSGWGRRLLSVILVWMHH